MKKSVCVIFICAILTLCAVPSVGMLIFGPSAAGANERLAARPSVTERDGKINMDVLTDAGDYIGDRFFLRQELITGWAYLNAALLRTSASEDVILGGDGWLYYGPTLADYTGAEKMDGRELFSAARNLALIDEYCEENGAELTFTVAPNKNSLYPEHMPEYERISQEKNAEALEAELARQGVSYIDLFAAFSAVDETLYLKQDSHWSTKGAALAADTLLAALSRESAFISDGFSKMAAHSGDLYTMLYPAGKGTEPDPLPDHGPEYAIISQQQAADSIRLETSGGGEGTLLMFRDSFGNNLYPYMAAAFDKALFSRLSAYDLGLLHESGAESVIIELVERNIDYLITYAPVMPAPERKAPEYELFPDTLVSVISGGAAPEGFVRLSGSLPLPADERSEVYILSGDTAYEAFLLADGGFCAAVPESAAEGELSVVFTQDGRRVGCEIKIGGDV